MRLKTKLYLFQLLLSVIVLLFMFITYQNYEVQYKKDINTYITEKAYLYKQLFMFSYEKVLYFHLTNRKKQQQLTPGETIQKIYTNFLGNCNALLNENAKLQLYSITEKNGSFAIERNFGDLQTNTPNPKQKHNLIRSYKEENFNVTYNGENAIISLLLLKDHTTRHGIVLHVELNIASKILALKRYKNYFYVSLIVTFLFLIVTFCFVHKNFTEPFGKIIYSITKKQKVYDKAILNTNNELSIIAKKYNTLLDSLQKEVTLNKELLEENKTFIIDTLHQIKTPLTNILMNAEMVQKQTTTQESLHHLEQISASIEMLTNSYEDLSYIISCDTILYKPTQLNLSAVLKQRVAFFSTLAKVYQKKFLTDITPDLFYTINQIELERIIDNNIANAIKYAQTNKPVTITLAKQNDTYVLSFASYGKKIQHPHKIFEKSYREDNSKRGLGLGLFMVQTICAKYNIKYHAIYENSQNIFKYYFKSDKNTT